MSKKRLWIGLIIILAIWQMMHMLIDPRLIPSPFDATKTLISLIVSGELLVHSLYSLFRLIVAVVLALMLGLLSGIVMGLNKTVDKIMSPLVYILFPVPKAALLPIIFVLFGLGDLSKIILIWLILYFQVVLSVYDSVKNIEPYHFVSGKTLRLSKLQTYRHIVLPAIFPEVLSALRTSVGIGIAVLFFAETYATDKGLGYFIMNNWSLLNYKEMYSGIILLGAIGYVIFSLIDYIRYRFIKWL